MRPDPNIDYLPERVPHSCLQVIEPAWSTRLSIINIFSTRIVRNMRKCHRNCFREHRKSFREKVEKFCFVGNVLGKPKGSGRVEEDSRVFKNLMDYFVRHHGLLGVRQLIMCTQQIGAPNAPNLGRSQKMF